MDKEKARASMTEVAQNKDEKEELAAPTRRNMLTTCVGISSAVGAVGIMGKVALDLVTQYRAANASIDTFGTIDNLTYRVNTDLPFTPIQPYRVWMQTFHDDLSVEDTTRANSFIKTITGTLYNQTLKHRESIRAASGKDRARWIDPSPLLDSLTELELSLSKLKKEISAQAIAVKRLRLEMAKFLIKARELKYNSSSSLEAPQLGPPDLYVRNVVTKITGKELPPGMKLSIRPIDQEGVMGYAHFSTQEAVARDQIYEGVALTFAHEVGHLISVHQEAYVTGRGPRPRTKEEVMNWEEACAYAFEVTFASYLAATDEVTGPTAYGLFLVDKRPMIEEFYTGEESTECHRVGMAYFDAALTVLGSPGAAYNYLSSHVELSPEMVAVLEENKSNTSKRGARRSIVEKRITDLKGQIAKVREHFGGKEPS